FTFGGRDGGFTKLPVAVDFASGHRLKPVWSQENQASQVLECFALKHSLSSEVTKVGVQVFGYFVGHLFLGPSWVGFLDSLKLNQSAFHQRPASDLLKNPFIEPSEAL